MGKLKVGLAMALAILIAGQLPAQAGDQKLAEQLVTRAWNLVGLDRLPEKSRLAERLNVEMIVGQDSTSPYLADEIDGKRVWRARCEKVLLQFEKWADHPISSREYDLEVYFDSATGQMLKITLLNDQHDTALVKKPSAESAERQLKHLKRSRPSGDPPTSLMEILANLPRSPLPATEIVAYYWLIDLYNSDELHPVWTVYLYGSPSFGIKGHPELPLSDRSYVRWLVHATTGHPLISSNLPVP